MGRGKGVRASSTSSIQVEFRYRGVRCRERLRLAPTPANLKYAERLKAEVESQIARGTFDYAATFPESRHALQLGKVKGNAVTIEKWLWKWHAAVASEMEPETHRDYELDIQNKILPHFGKKPIAQVTRTDAKAFIASLPLSKKRIDNILIPLRQAFQLAYEDELIARSPFAGVEVKRVSRVREVDVIDPFTVAEIDAICEAATEIATLVRFNAWTGLRVSELIALLWGDVDLEGRTLRIQRARREGRDKATKTQAGTRATRLLEPAAEALKAQKAVSLLAGKEVFLNPQTGKGYQTDKQLREWQWRRALKRAGVRYRYPNQLRHTCASWLLSSGENPLWVARQLGHRDPAFTMRTYARWMPTQFPDAGAKAIAALGKETRGTQEAVT
jgi:integrase